MMFFMLLFLLTYISRALSGNFSEADLHEIDYHGDFSVTLPSVNSSVGANGTFHAGASLARVLDFFNTELLALKWGETRKLVSAHCSRDIEKFIKGLDKTETWALKMEDASGRYSTGWFWGNHYWTGSQSLCENIAPKTKTLQLATSEIHSRKPRDAKVPNQVQVSPSQSVGYKPGPLHYDVLPPFPISFFMLRAHINSNFTTEEKLLHIGLCMPDICSNDDIRHVMEETAKASPWISVTVEAVRSQHNYFNVWRDRTFIILCIATSFVTALLIVGTIYDLYLDHCEHERVERQLLYSKNLENAPLKLEIKMADKHKKRNSGLYVINNKTLNNNDPDVLQTFDLSIHSEEKEENLFRMIVKEAILSFSLRKNIKAICDQSVGSDTIPAIHGLKSISMAWVILGHTCIVAFKYSDNMEYRKVVQREFFFQTISNGAFSVDTFFFTSGLLVSYLYFRTNAKGKLDPLTKGRSGFFAGVLHFFGLIFYRFARLTAPYLFTLGLVEVAMKWFNYNSIFEPPTMDHENCPNYWWRNVLYINTLFSVDEMCMLWSWYLSDDTQFYVVGAIMLILATRHFKCSAVLLLIFMTSSWITTGYIAYSNSHVPGSDDPLALFDKIYDKPWTRLGPYLVGMCVGWYLFKKNCQLKMSKLMVLVGWAAALACLMSLVYGLYDVNLSPMTGAAYSSLSHSAWALGLAWIIVACETGYGGFANTILSSTVLYPFSRVTYCAYLLHPIVIRVMAMNMDSPLHLGSLVMITIYLGQVVASYGLAFFVSLAFEAPVVSMLRIMQKVVAVKKKTQRTDLPMS